MPGFHITTQDDLPGPDGDEPYVLFVNQTEYGNARFLRTNVLSARPDLKKYTALRFRQEVKRHTPYRCRRAGSRTSRCYGVFAYFGLCQDVYARSLTN